MPSLTANILHGDLNVKLFRTSESKVQITVHPPSYSQKESKCCGSHREFRNSAWNISKIIERKFDLVHHFEIQNLNNRKFQTVEHFKGRTARSDVELHKILLKREHQCKGKPFNLLSHYQSLSILRMPFCT